MGKKGVKKKTRWRTLSISTPQPEEEESERVRNSYETSGRNYEKNSYINNGNARSQRYSTYHNRNNHSTTSSKLPKDEDSESSGNQQKYIFNEEEYTRITTPRQDVLFKKGYLTQKKPWTSLSSPSATPSTTESQSASHSTADGSETIEDQQLLDMNPGEYNSMTDPVTQLNYATYYNHAGGYYHECPMMLVGPVIPDPTVSNVITTMPCAPVPMGPIEWFNPGYPAKVGSPQQCLLDYHAQDCATLVDHEEISTNISTMYNGHGMITDRDGSCTGSIEKDNQIEECIDYNEELLEDDSIIEDPYMSTMAAHQMHMTHMIPQPVTSSYCYSGHYLVGPMIMNTNGMPIQSDPTLRCDDAMSSSVEQVCTKRKKKRKKKKTKRQSTIANGEDEDEDEYSSEYETYVSSVKTPWALNEIPTNKNNQSLNPNCQEFQYQPTYVDYNNVTDNFNDESSNSNSISPSIFTPMESNSSLSTDNATEIDEKKSVEECVSPLSLLFKNNFDNMTIKLIEQTKSVMINDTSEPKKETNINNTILNNETFVQNGKTSLLTDNEINQNNSSTDSSQTLINENSIKSIDKSKISDDLTKTNGSVERKDSSHNKASNLSQRRKYTSRSSKFVRELTPGPDLSSFDNLKIDDMVNDKNSIHETYNNHVSTEKISNIKVSTTDTKNNLPENQIINSNKENKRPITKAVNEWLKNKNNSIIFSLSDSDDDDDINKKSKNLISNPMPALSVNNNNDKRKKEFLINFLIENIFKILINQILINEKLILRICF